MSKKLWDARYRAMRATVELYPNCCGCHVEGKHRRKATCFGEVGGVLGCACDDCCTHMHTDNGWCIPLGGK